MDTNLFDLMDYLKEKCGLNDRQCMKKHKLNVSEYTFFISLKKCTCINSCILAQSMGISLSRISRVIDSLVKKNLLERTIDEKDRRSINLKLSPSGLLLSQKINRFRQKNENKLLQKISKQDLNTIKDSIKTLTELL